MKVLFEIGLKYIYRKLKVLIIKNSIFLHFRCNNFFGNPQMLWYYQIEHKELYIFSPNLMKNSSVFLFLKIQINHKNYS